MGHSTFTQEELIRRISNYHFADMVDDNAGCDLHDWFHRYFGQSISANGCNLDALAQNNST